MIRIISIFCLALVVLGSASCRSNYDDAPLGSGRQMSDYLKRDIILNASGVDIRDADLRQLKDKRFAKVTDVYLRGSKITNNALIALEELSLERLVLTSTQLDGSNAELLLSHPLEVLYLGFTRFDDEAFEDIGKLYSLRDLDVTATELTDRGMQHLSSLKLNRFKASDTSISDVGLSFLPVEALKNLDLRSTSISDDTVARLVRTGLEFLNLSDTAISEGSIAMLSKLPLRVLDVSRTGISDGSVAELSKMKLSSLSLEETRVSGGSIKLLPFDTLRALNIGRTAIRGDALGLLGEKTELRSLNLAKLELKDDDLIFLKGMKLESLVLSENPVTDKVFNHLGLGNLKRLEICGTKISSAAIDSFRKSYPGIQVSTTFQKSRARTKLLMRCV